MAQTAFQFNFPYPQYESICAGLQAKKWESTRRPLQLRLSSQNQENDELTSPSFEVQVAVYRRYPISLTAIAKYQSINLL